MRSHLLLALRILRRRRFFTFISLFGISFTIMALVVFAAIGDAALGDAPPLGDRNRLVFATTFQAQKMIPDTTYLVDSSRVGANGVTVYDSTRAFGTRRESNSTGGIGYYLYDRSLRMLPGAEAATYYTPSLTFDTYLGGRKVTLQAAYTDATFWEVLDYAFIAGRPYTSEDVTAGAPRAVLSERSALAYFGQADSAILGRAITLGDRDYEVAGVVATPRTAFLNLNRGVFLPYTTAAGDFEEPSYLGGGLAVFRASESVGRAKIVAELDRVAAGLDALPGEDYNRFTLEGLTFAQQYAGDLLSLREDRHRAVGRLLPIALGLLALFVLLPALNLMNVNVSRVYERASEIAVRKSFGATDQDILRQFLVETLVVTLIGGGIGVVLGLGAIELANAIDWIQGFRLAFTPEVAFWSLIATVAFALLTGALPAWRMAQTRIANSLR